jgi:hypothetical protein
MSYFFVLRRMYIFWLKWKLSKQAVPCKHMSRMSRPWPHVIYINIWQANNITNIYNKHCNIGMYMTGLILE